MTGMAVSPGTASADTVRIVHFMPDSQGTFTRTPVEHQRKRAPEETAEVWSLEAIAARVDRCPVPGE
jgi:hypothetical protein